MKKIVVWVVFLNLILSLNLFAATEIMPVDELKPGMKGIGKTVFRGMDIEEYSVEIISVMKNSVGPGHDMILAKASGGVLEVAGSIQGMSGSPIYIDGKLIGAQAYGWSYMKETIIGITPIQEMLEIFDRADEGDLGVNFHQKSFYLKEVDGTIQLADEYKKATQSVTINDMELLPTRTPLMCSGVSSSVFSMMKPIFEDLGFEPTQSGGSSKSLEEMDAPLVPGAAVSAVMVSGDMDISGIGTLTYRDDDKILAFGHPMFEEGKVDVPLAGAYIHTVMPSMVHSFKMGSPTKIVGSVIQDRKTGILGQIGNKAPMIPVQVSVSSPNNGRQEVYNYQVMNSQNMISMLSLLCTFQSLSAYESSAGKYTLNFEMTIKIEGYPDVHLEDFITGTTGLPVAAGFKMAGTVFELINNPFKKINIEKIEINAEYVSDDVQIAIIRGIRINKTSFRPGERVDVNLMINPYNGDQFFRNCTFDIPEDFPDGDLVLIASNMEVARQVDWERSPSKRPENVEQMIEAINKVGNSSHIKIQLIELGMGATVKGKDLPTLPPSILTVMTTNSNEFGTTGINIAKILKEKIIKSNYKMEGYSVVSLKVDRNSK